MKCSNCGRELNDDDKFCMGCGTKVEPTTPVEVVKENAATEENATSADSVVETSIETVPTTGYQYYQYPQSQQPKNGKGAIIAIIIMAVIILAGIIFALWYFVLRGDDSKDKNVSNNTSNHQVAENNNVNTNTTTPTNPVQSHNTSGYLPPANNSSFKYKAALTERNKLLVFTKNETSKVYDIEIEVEFYDANGKLVGNDNEYLFGIAPNQEIVTLMYSTPDEFDNYKVYIDEKESSYKSSYKDITVTTNDNKAKGEIIIQAKNNSGQEVSSIEVGIVFYKNNKVVGYDYDFDTSIDSGRSANLSVYYPYDKNYDNIDFDNFEVYINEAYNYNYKY